MAHGRREETLENFRDYFPNNVKFIEVKNFTRNINIMKDLKALLEIRKIVKNEKPDIVHLHSSKAGILGRVAIHKKNIKMFYNPHGFSFLKKDDSKIKRFIYKSIEKIAAILNRNCTIIGCSKGEHEEARKLNKNSININNGITVNKIDEELKNEQKSQIDYNNLRVCTVGRIGFQKNPKLFNEIAENFPEIQFTWIGDGELKSELASPNIKITGWKERKEVLHELNKNDIFLLPSLWEGLPISLLEAMYMQKICIVSSCIGNSDVIENGKNGFIINSVEDFKKVIQNIIQNKDIDKITGQAKKDVLEKYNTDQMVEIYKNLYGIKKNNEKIKVLEYTERWGTGGIEAFIMNIYRNIDLNKFVIDILTSQNESSIYDNEIKKYNGQKNITLEEFYSSPIIRVIKNLKKYKEKIKYTNYDILHLNIGNGVSLIYAYLAKKQGIKRIIVHSHNTGIKKKNYIIKLIGHEICKRLFCRYATDFLACSDKAAQWLFPKKYQKNVTIINNGIYVDKYKFSQEERQQLRKKLHIEEDKLVIGNIGRFTEQKNHGFLIDIFKIIHSQNANSILFLVGEGELEDSIRNKVKQLNLEESVIFFGTTNKVPAVLSAMDIFVLPSLYEGNPVVGIEAQASGLPCFFSSNITKYAKITSNVHYISLEDKEEWSKVILKNGTNIDNRKSQTEIVRNAGFDIKDVIKKIEEIYLKER